MVTRWMCVWFCAGLWTPVISAQAPDPLTLEDCTRLALAGPSAASMAERQVAASREGQGVARAAFLPQFGLQNSFTYNSPLIRDRQVFSHVALNGIREYLFLFNSTWEIDLSGRLRAASALARATRDLSQADLKVAQRDLRRAVAGAYYDVLLTRRIAALEEEALAEARSFEKRIRAMQAKGEASMADIHKAAAQTARFEQRLSQARLNARLANQVLASFWTRDVDRNLELVDVFDKYPPPPSETESPDGAALEAVRQRPEFDRLAALETGYRAERSAAKSALRPRANVIFQYGLDSNAVRINDRGYAAFVSLGIPLFDWFGSRSAARRARYLGEQVEQQRLLTEREFLRQYMAARSQVRSWYERIPMASNEFRSAKENLRLSQLLYVSGEGLALEVVTARTQTTDSGASYYAAIAAYLRALKDFEVASGK